MVLDLSEAGLDWTLVDVLEAEIEHPGEIDALVVSGDGEALLAELLDPSNVAAMCAEQPIIVQGWPLGTQDMRFCRFDVVVTRCKPS